MAHVPASHGARYGRPPSDRGAYQPPNPSYQPQNVSPQPSGARHQQPRAYQPPNGSYQQPGAPYQQPGAPYQPPGAGYQQPRAPQQPGPPYPRAPHQQPRPRYDDAGWDAPTHTVAAGYAAVPPQAPVRERGVRGWFAVAVLIVIASIGGAYDLLNGSQVRGGFNIGIVVASIVAILIVRRRSMFPVLVAPPLVYFAASSIILYARSGGLHDRKVLLDAAANWLVYGFPAIAGATASVLIIAGIRMFAGR